MYFASSITLLLLPLTLADKNLRGLVSDPNMASNPSGYTATKGVSPRQAGPCGTLLVAYHECFTSRLNSTQVDSCIDCITGKFPELNQEGKVRCTEYLDFHCHGPASCSACSECADIMSAWGVCEYDNTIGCPPAECPS